MVDWPLFIVILGFRVGNITALLGDAYKSILLDAWIYNMIRERSVCGTRRLEGNAPICVSVRLSETILRLQIPLKPKLLGSEKTITEWRFWYISNIYTYIYTTYRIYSIWFIVDICVSAFAAKSKHIPSDDQGSSARAGIFLFKFKDIK